MKFNQTFPRNDKKERREGGKLAENNLKSKTEKREFHRHPQPRKPAVHQLCAPAFGVCCAKKTATRRGEKLPLFIFNQAKREQKGN